MSDTILMKIASISGECVLPNYAKQIVLLSFSHSVAMPMTSDPFNTKRTSGTAHVSEITVSKFLDSASASLNQKCLQGIDLGEVVITLLQSDQEAVIEMMKYTLSNVMISSVSIGGGGGLPTETVSLNFTKIAWAYMPQKKQGGADGTAAGTWDLTTNKAA